MQLSDFITDTDAVLDKAFQHPVMKIKPRAANPYPSLDDALKATLNAIEYAVIEAVAADIRPVLEDVLLNRIIMDGEFADSDNPDEWESATDDAVEEAIERYVPVCSQDWLGNHTIGCGLHLDNGVETFAISLGREVYKQLTYAQQKSPAKIMSAAGIVQKDVQERLTIHNQPKEEKSMDELSEGVSDTLQKVADYVGKDYDVIAIYDDFDQASDDDDVLAQGAAARIGLDEEDVEVLRNERLMHGDDTPQILCDQLAEIVAGGGKKKPAAKKAPAKAADKPAVAPKKAKAEKAAASTEGAVGSSTFKKMKDACAFKDAEAAQNLGVSRATFNNYVNGKAQAKLTDDQKTILRDDIVTRLNLLHEALAELDGTEAHTVF